MQVVCGLMMTVYCSPILWTWVPTRRKKKAAYVIEHKAHGIPNDVFLLKTVNLNQAFSRGTKAQKPSGLSVLQKTGMEPRQPPHSDPRLTLLCSCFTTQFLCLVPKRQGRLFVGNNSKNPDWEPRVLVSNLGVSSCLRKKKAGLKLHCQICSFWSFTYT